MATLQWDHTVQYVRDLEKTMGIFKENGLHAFFGGSHTKWGTYNALSYFGLTYIEFLGVENDELARNITEPNQVVKDAVKWLPDHEILSRVAIRTDDIDAVVNRLSESGLDHSPIMEGKRLNAQGQLIEWKMVTIAGDSQGLDYPFFIQWSQTDEERFGSLKEAGAITQHPAGDLTIQKAVFHVTNPVEVASHWNKVFGLSAIEQEGNEAKVNLGDKQFVFKQGNQNALTQLVFDASSSVLKGKTFKIGEGEYVFL